MKFYETMYIVHPILEMGRLHDLILDIEKNLSEKGGEVVYTKVIGKKRMAYPIQKQKFGTYVLIQFKSDGSSNNDFSFDLEMEMDFGIILNLLQIRMEMVYGHLNHLRIQTKMVFMMKVKTLLI